MDAEDTGSGKEDEPEQEVNSEQEDDDGAGPSTSAGGNSTSSNRQQRNIAEKMRRDKLNFFINELSTLVPIISFSPKKLDKTSILRLAATYIRLHNVVFGSPRRESRSSSQRQMLEYLPQYLASFNWSENVLEDMEGMLMIVNGAGRIIFISHTVEKLLGHTQIELMGQSLYNLTCLEDYDELKKNLAPNKDPNSTVVSGDTGDESSSDSVSISVPTPPSNVTTSSDQEQRQRRSFFVRLKQRAQSRGDQPQYVLVHVVGHLRVPQPSARRPNQPPNHNDVILVAVVKPFQEKRFTTLSLMEACREEFITRHTLDGRIIYTDHRHTLDGRIIYTDHRISIVAGYLSEEVCGVPGFQYMHKEDFRWTMIGLRQMFFRGSSYGQSCYRLQTKNGSFIYLKTCGYLELSENNDSFQSLICINSLVSSAEGEALIRKMKEQYFPMIKNKEDVNMEMLSSNIQEIGNGDDGETVDQGEMQAAIGQMISNLPTPSPLSSGLASPCSSSMDPDPQLAKAMLLMKTLPPSCTQAMNIGIDPMIIKTSSSSVAASLSPPTSHHSPSPQPQPQQNRPSVLRMKRMRTDEQGQSQEVVTVSPRSVVVSPPLSRGKRKSSEEGEWSPVTPTPTTPTTITNIAPPLSPHFSLDSVLLNGEDIENSLLNITDINMIPGDEESPPSLVSNLEKHSMMRECGSGTSTLLNNYKTAPVQPVAKQEVDMYLSWGQSELTEELESSQVMEVLDSRLSLQDEQMQKIQQELEQVSQSPQALNSRLNQLQVEHRKQQQLLKTLQQDHLCSGQQDINV